MDTFERPVYCLLGLPFDAVTMSEARDIVQQSALQGRRCFMSTPNLNFLIGCQDDSVFRDSVVHSDLSIADGMPLVWMARLLRIPLPERVSGSGLFDVLWRGPAKAGRKLSVFFFGGPEGIAARACERLNAANENMTCAGALFPGYGDLAAMSGEVTLDAVNASKADLVIVAIGARRGQAWIEHNLDQIRAPAVANLGAVVNFVAGTVSRAPVAMQKMGLEWLWRIKEEPDLWKRYWKDGRAMLGILMTRVLPYAIWLRMGGKGHARPFSLRLEDAQGDLSCRLAVQGDIPDQLDQASRAVFRQTAGHAGNVTLDFHAAGRISPAFFGLVLMLKKQLDRRGAELLLTGVSSETRRQFYWNGVEYLLG